MEADMDSPGKSLFLIGISIELLTYIQLFLDPVDILALRFTCKHLSSTTRSRVVWMNAVRNVCTAQGVFLPSFPVEQMSVDDLEHAALSPGRLQARFQKADRTTPFLTRLFTPHLQGGDLVPNSILTVNLVPGGRFLITSNKKGEVHLWDMGYNAGGRMKIFPIATLAGSEATRVDHIGPASNSDSIYVFTSELGERISYYEIFPTSEDPHFSQLGTLSINGVDNQSTISKDYLVYYQHEESIITVWKYMAQGLGASWVVSHPGALYEMFIFDKTVITFYNTDFCLWTIPDLTPLIDGHATLIEWKPKLHLACLSIDEGGPKVALPSPWLPELARNQFCVYYDEIPTMAIYRIKSIDTSHEPDLPNILAIHSGSVQSSFYHEIDYLGPLHITEDGFLQTWAKGKDINIGIISKPSPNNPTCSFVRSSVWTGSGRDFHYDFCPMTGRLIVRTSRPNGGPEVQIVDFILPRSFL